MDLENLKSAEEKKRVIIEADERIMFSIALANVNFKKRRNLLLNF